MVRSWSDKLTDCRNAMPRDLIVPGISRDGFRRRLGIAVGWTDQETVGSSQVPEAPSVARENTAPATESSTASPRNRHDRYASTPSEEPAETVRHDRNEQRKESIRAGKQKLDRVEDSQPTETQSPTNVTTLKATEEKVARIRTTNVVRQTAPTQKPRTQAKASPPVTQSQKTETSTNPPPKPSLSAPKQYRLQVRLFDGSSVRSTFSPDQTIRSHVRPWLDEQMADEPRPYNLKHILTPLPNRTITIADEEQTLQELGLGPTASLVTVPISSYTEAYASTGANLPVRGAYAAYGLVSSAVSAASGMVGSLFGYGSQSSHQQQQQENLRRDPALSSSLSPQSRNDFATREASDARTHDARTRPSGFGGANVRTLREHEGERDETQWYNGNQVCLLSFLGHGAY